MIKLSDYIVRRLRAWDVERIFMVTGGGAMHINDSVGKPGGLSYVCTHHEQAAAIAAEGYSRISGKLGVISVTSGPGGTNAITGVMGAWTDSLPMLVLSGQVKRETCIASYPECNLRQLGDQETDIIPVVRSFTKYSKFVDDPASIRYHLEKAYFLTTHGRPGPCWLDLPLDVQASPVDPAALKGFFPEKEYPSTDLSHLPELCAEISTRIREAKRPVILAGSGVRQSGTVEEFRYLSRMLQVPVVLSRTAHDLLPTDDLLRCGRAGIDADRAGNIVVQNADLVLVLGSRLGIRQVSYNFDGFAPRAFKYQVDIDPAELSKPTLTVDKPVLCDLRDFFAAMNACVSTNGHHFDAHRDWVRWSRSRVDQYPGVTAKHRSDGAALNPYVFLEALSIRFADDEVIACANGAAFIMTFHAVKTKSRQRLFFNSGTASMGYDIPAAVGAAFANDGKRVICIAGEGSAQMNIQELQTIVHHHLPVKIFVLNNGGYLSIRTTQLGFFGNLVGESCGSGVSFPDMVKIGEAYGIPSMRIQSLESMSAVDEMLAAPGPALIEVMVNPDQQFEPRSSSRQLPDGQIVSPPLEDMYPFLDREEMAENIRD